LVGPRDTAIATVLRAILISLPSIAKPIFRSGFNFSVHGTLRLTFKAGKVGLIVVRAPPGSVIEPLSLANLQDFPLVAKGRRIEWPSTATRRTSGVRLIQEWPPRPIVTPLSHRAKGPLQFMPALERFNCTQGDLVGNGRAVDRRVVLGTANPLPSTRPPDGRLRDDHGSESGYFDMSMPSLALISSKTTLIAWMISLSWWALQ
jgi:hypothetical protein